MTAPRKIRYRRPPLYGKQTDAIFCPERYAIVEASTKSGKTHGCIAWLFEQAVTTGRPGRNYWWVAPVYPQAKIAFRRMKRAVPKALFRAKEDELTMTIANGAVIWFKSGEKPDNLYGDDVYAAVIDEASRLRSESWHAVRSTLTKTRGPARIIGNVKGRKNWAYVMARRAEAGAKDMRYSKITAYDAVEAGVLDASEIQDAKDILPEDVFNELYLCIPSDDGGNPFGLKHIKLCARPEHRGRPGCTSTGMPTAWGWDLGKSSDWTVGTGLDPHGNVAGFERFRQPWGETERLIIEHTNAPALVDSTGVGDPIVERLVEHDPAMFDGFLFTQRSKQQLMEGLAGAIQRQEITFPDSGVLISELELFEYEYTRTGVKYTAPQGFHDDAVCSLALAVARWTSERLVGDVLEIETEMDPTGGFAF